MSIADRYDRNERFFGHEGQQKLGAARVAVVGVGGLGTHVVQQLALLGVGGLVLVDPEELDDSNRNRYVGARASDAVPGTPKVRIGERLASEIDTEISVLPIQQPLASRAAFSAIIECGYVFGSLDSDGPRLILTELCAAYELPYADLASDIVDGGKRYGGRIVIAQGDGDGCLSCLGQLDVAEPAADEAIYGVPQSELGGAGPSVVSINGVIASLGVTEFMVSVTGLRAPHRFLQYRANEGRVSGVDRKPEPGCWYCSDIRGQREQSGILRYIKGR